MEMKTLQGVPVEVIAETFNEAFSDYFVPVRLTPEQLAAKMRADKVDLGCSAGAFEGGRLVGFMLYGVDEVDGTSVAYNGGTGVIPDMRGRGLTERMHGFILPVLKGEGVEKMTLEVISDNARAIKSYKQAGYEVVRELDCYKGAIAPRGGASGLELRMLQDYDWRLMRSFWDFTPSWQNSAHVLDSLRGETMATGAYVEGELAGYVIYNPAGRRIHQIAVGRDFRRRGVGSALLAGVAREAEGEWSVINVEAGSSPIHGFLRNAGFARFLGQLEMGIEL